MDFTVVYFLVLLLLFKYCHARSVHVLSVVAVIVVDVIALVV